MPQPRKYATKAESMRAYRARRKMREPLPRTPDAELADATVRRALHAAVRNGWEPAAGLLREAENASALAVLLYWVALQGEDARRSSAAEEGINGLSPEHRRLVRDLIEALAGSHREPQ